MQCCFDAYLILAPLTGLVELDPLRQRGDAVLPVHLKSLDPTPTISTHTRYFQSSSTQPPHVQNQLGVRMFEDKQ